MMEMIFFTQEIIVLFLNFNDILNDLKSIASV